MMISEFLEMPVTITYGYSSANVPKWSGTGQRIGAGPRPSGKRKSAGTIGRSHGAKLLRPQKETGVFLRLLKPAGENVLNILLIFRIGAQDICQ